jgi:catechol 2,3-dioxygenase-like lactoylglutathione lyase family enzyme
MPISSGFNHVATLTPDLDRFAEWYGKVFGAEVRLVIDKREDHARMFILDMGGGAALNVFEVAPEEIIGERRHMNARGAIDHFGIAVDSLETLREVEQRLVAVGADIGQIQKLGHDWSLFFRDVDGMELEVLAHAE